MSIDPNEAEREEAYLELYEEHAKQALEEFRAERLVAYYLAHPDVARAPLELLVEARKLRGVSPSGSLALASGASEAGLKLVVLRPIVVGLVHTDALADHIADLILQHQALDRFKDLLFAILSTYAGIEISTYQRAGAPVPIWEEVKRSAVRRNALLHRCEPATAEDADLALAVASEVLAVLYPTLLRNLDLHLHGGWRVCNQYHIPDDVATLLGRTKRVPE